MTVVSPFFRIALLTALCAVWLAPSTATAQQSKPTEAQFKLYEEGVEAFRDGDYPKAIDLFRASLHLGELNITYLNLGRALFKIGECKEAAVAYDKVERSPTIAQPTPAQVRAKLEEYRASMNEGCPASVVVECNGEMVLTIDDKAHGACTPEPIALPPGTHTIQGVRGDVMFEETITLTAMQQVTIALGRGAGTKVSGSRIRKIGPGPGVKKDKDKRPLITIGARIGSLLSGDGNLDATLSNGEESLSSDAAFTEGSSVFLNGYAMFGINDFLSFGGSVWILPTVDLLVEGGNGQASGESNEIDLNGMVMFALPLNNIDAFAYAEAGLTRLAPFDNDVSEESFLGFNFGAGVGAQLRLNAIVLSSDLRFQSFDAGRTFTDGNFDVEENLAGTRLVVNFGIALGLF